MPSFSESLEKTLHNALKAASERHHEYATLEHLRYALIDDEHAAEVMRACGVALGELQSAVVHYLDTELDSLKVEGHSDPSPTSGFQRVVQRAILHVQSSGKDEVTGANVLVALFSDCLLYTSAFLFITFRISLPPNGHTVYYVHNIFGLSQMARHDLTWLYQAYALKWNKASG